MIAKTLEHSLLHLEYVLHELYPSYKDWKLDLLDKT